MQFFITKVVSTLLSSLKCLCRFKLKPTEILAKYDEEIEGVKKESFELGQLFFYYKIYSITFMILYEM